MPFTSPTGRPKQTHVRSERDPLAPGWKSVREIARRMERSEDSVRRWICEGMSGHKLPAIRVGVAFQIHELDLREFLVLVETRCDSPAQVAASTAEQPADTGNVLAADIAADTAAEGETCG